MADFITLTCPSCGGKLEITNDIDLFACAHCGTEHIVNRGGGIISLKPVVAEFQKIREGTDKTASELAISRLKNEISALQHTIVEQSQSTILLLPVGRYLRYGLQKIGKLNFWNVGFASDKQLSEIIRNLTLENVDDLINYFGGRGLAMNWLKNYRGLVAQVQEKKDQMKVHQKVIG